MIRNRGEIDIDTLYTLKELFSVRDKMFLTTCRLGGNVEVGSDPETCCHCCFICPLYNPTCASISIYGLHSVYTT